MPLGVIIMPLLDLGMLMFSVGAGWWALKACTLQGLTVTSIPEPINLQIFLKITLHTEKYPAI